jgi:hypothetical protein
MQILPSAWRGQSVSIFAKPSGLGDSEHPFYKVSLVERTKGPATTDPKGTTMTLDNKSAALFVKRPIGVFLYCIYLAAFAKYMPAQDCSLAVDLNRDSIVYLKAEKTNPKNGAVAIATGTGFFVSPDGYILTDYHVVRSDPDWNVVVAGAQGSAEAQQFGVTIVDTDPREDVALLKVKETNRQWRSVYLGDPNAVTGTVKLCSAGFPSNDQYQYEFHPSEGPLGGKGGPGGRWTTQMPSNHGESGAPVFTVDGIVVALKWGGDSQMQNINLLTPINLANGLLIKASPRPPSAVPPVLLANGLRTLSQSEIITASVEDAGPNLRLTLTSPVGVYPTARFDVNANGVLDPRVDVGYGLGAGGGTPCTVYLESLDATTPCGQFQSSATLQHSQASNISQNIWLIPKAEICKHPGNFAGLVLDIIDSRPPGHRVFIPGPAFSTLFDLIWK